MYMCSSFSKTFATFPYHFLVHSNMRVNGRRTDKGLWTDKPTRTHLCGSNDHSEERIGICEGERPAGFARRSSLYCQDVSRDIVIVLFIYNL